MSFMGFTWRINNKAFATLRAKGVNKPTKINEDANKSKYSESSNFTIYS
jgi:hypothetical protein